MARRTLLISALLLLLLGVLVLLLELRFTLHSTTVTPHDTATASVVPREHITLLGDLRDLGEIVLAHSDALQWLQHQAREAQLERLDPHRDARRVTAADTTELIAAAPVDVDVDVAAIAVPPSQNRQQQQQQQHAQCTHRAAVMRRTNMMYEPRVDADALRRSRAHVGNAARVRRLAARMARGEGVHVLALGGSVTRGHGIVDTHDNAWPGQLVTFLRTAFPVNDVDGNDGDGGQPTRKLRTHVITDASTHGADMCFVEQRVNQLLNNAHADATRGEPDLVVLEFAINDYEAQDDERQLVFFHTPFFDGFQGLATCAEAVVRTLLERTTAAVVFLEFRTAVERRHTGATLHHVVAAHYGVPVISHADAFISPFFEQMDELFEYHLPTNATRLPPPYGCADKCFREDAVHAQFKCNPICKLILGAEAPPCLSPKRDATPCYSYLFAHDEVHPSALSHRLAADLVGHWMIDEFEIQCLADAAAATAAAGGGSSSGSKAAVVDDGTIKVNGDEHLAPLPTLNDRISPFGVMASPIVLRARTDVVAVNSTMMESGVPMLEALKSRGFRRYDDTKYHFGRVGWVADNVTDASAEVVFEVKQPKGCYTVSLGYLRSYENMGVFVVWVVEVDAVARAAAAAAARRGQRLDGLWRRHISVWSETQLRATCSGHCHVIVRTATARPPREKNKVKVISMAVRRCSSTTAADSNVGYDRAPHNGGGAENELAATVDSTDWSSSSFLDSSDSRDDDDDGGGGVNGGGSSGGG